MGRTKQYVIAIALLLAATVVAFVALFNLFTTPPQSDSEISLSGTTVCLPHKNTSGPTTLECAIGLQAEDGRYYALKNIPSMQAAQTEVEVVVKGTLSTPNPDEKYDISGVIDVRAIDRK